MDRLQLSLSLDCYLLPGFLQPLQSWTTPQHKPPADLVIVRARLVFSLNWQIFDGNVGDWVNCPCHCTLWYLHLPLSKTSVCTVSFITKQCLHIQLALQFSLKPVCCSCQLALYIPKVPLYTFGLPSTTKRTSCFYFEARHAGQLYFYAHACV